MSTSSKTVAKPATKAETLAALADASGLDRKQVAACLDALAAHVAAQLGRKGPGVAVVPDVVRLKRVRKPATRAREGRNPANGEPMTFAAKPARDVVKAFPVKALKEV